METIKLTIRHQYSLNITKWDTKNPKGVIQLIHGSLEHCARYDEMAKFFNKNGFSVIGSDHRGHGKTAEENNETLGHVGNNVDHQFIIKDLIEVNKYIKKNNKKIPIVLFGHSWGSFLARNLLAIPSFSYNGAILSGTGWVNKFSSGFAIKYLKFLKILNFGNESKTSKLLQKVTFNNFNKKYKKSITGLEWVSNDKEEQQKFFKDPLRGEKFSNAGFKALIGATRQACSKKTISNTPTIKPIILVSGYDDPVGNFGKGVKKTEKKFKKCNHKFVKTIIYQGQRHEIHLDTNREEYFKDMIKWLNKYILNLNVQKGTL